MLLNPNGSLVLPVQSPSPRGMKTLTTYLGVDLRETNQYHRMQALTRRIKRTCQPLKKTNVGHIAKIKSIPYTM